MKKGQKAEGIVERLVFPNKGIVLTEENQRVIVKNTIPGQRVSFVVNKAKKGKMEGRLLEVLETSPLEKNSQCPHFGLCGGCNYQSLPYEEQLKLKESQVRDLLEGAIGNICDYPFLGIKKSPLQYGYRNKMEFSFGDEYKDGPLALGMHKRGSFYDLVTVSDCQIVDGDFREILMTTLRYFSEQNIPYFHRQRHEGYLRHLLVRKASKTKEILVDLITTTNLPNNPLSEETLLNQWKDVLLSLETDGKLSGHLAGVLHTQNDSVADVIKNEGTEILYGQNFFYEELLGLRFQISPFSFFQTNSLGAEVLYETVREFILEAYHGGDSEEMRGATIYDLYSGTGTIAQMMASVCGHVVGVEIVEEAVEAAKENAKQNGLTNCDFLAGDVLKTLDCIEDLPDFIILDPPRDGIHPKALEKIVAYGVEHMVYISCKPTSLARDLKVLLERGYTIDKMVCVDMFPGTVHVETVVLLSKGEVDSKKIRVEFSLEDMDMSEFQDGATYQQIKEYVLEHTGLRVSNLYISHIKRKCGIEVGKNYNLPKSEDSRQPQCSPEKEKAIREAFKYFGMI